MSELSRQEAWEERYSGGPRWTGRPNAAVERWVTAAEHEGTKPTTAIDLGCGEGGDALWLASRGWKVTGVDFSHTAIERAAARSKDQGVDATWQVGDLTRWRPGAPADVVTACFIHEPFEVREDVWKTVAASVASGGTAVIVGHSIDEDESVPGPGREGRFVASEVTKALSAHGDWTFEIDELVREGVGAQEGFKRIDLVVVARSKR